MHKIMELVLKRIAKRCDYTIGRLSLSPDPSPVERGEIKTSPTGGGWRGLSLAVASSLRC